MERLGNVALPRLKPGPTLPARRRDMSESTIKDRVIEMIRRLPDDATVDDIMAELYFRQKVDEGLRQLEAGEGIDHDEARQRLGRWLS